MADRLQFQQKLSGLVKQCNENGQITNTEEVENYFAADHLSEEQMELVYDFLLSQKIIVKGYVKRGGTIQAADSEVRENHFTPEETAYLTHFEEELTTLPEGDGMKAELEKVVELAKEMHRPEVFLGDLVQEGSMGLMIAKEKGNASEEEIFQMVRQSMEALLEEQTEVKVRDRKMVERVKELETQIESLSKEMGRKVSVDELVQFANLSEEEIADTLKLAGEEIVEQEEE